MSRKVFVITGLMALCFSLFSYTTFWEESFSPAPGGWTLDNNWSFTSGALQLSWSPTITNYDLSAISPVITLPENVGDLVVKQFIDAFSPVNEIMEIAVIVDGNHLPLWQYELIGGNWGTTGGQDISLSLADFAGDDIQLEFRSYGESTYNLDYWYIYQATITALHENDMLAIEVYGPPNAEVDKPELWRVIVQNHGMVIQTNYTVKLMKDGNQEIGSLEIYDPIAPLEIVSHDFYWTPDQVEDLSLTGEVILDNEEFSSDNTTPEWALSIFPAGERQYLIWDNDNSSYYTDPNSGTSKNSEDGVEEALLANNINYDMVTKLPRVLRNYNVVFICLGLYCVG